ncbi:MAG: Re/Si-specific NAD(P)(+) transhydrogenase subunit alpha [Saprospiraceae bacterium]
MILSIPRELRPSETRVATTPDVVKQLVKAGFTCHVESGAGKGSFFSDKAYQDAGAVIISDKTELLKQTQILLKVNAPTEEEIAGLPQGASVISFLYAHTVPALVKALNDRQISSFAMDAVPRISRAQKMDALSSQANLAGYKAVLLGANESGKIFPMLMTAAGTITPAKVLIFGAGVAGLQAIATAKRLGAVVEVTDVRPETKEQVESLGGKFLVVKSDEAVQVVGGYAKEVSAEYLQAQKELVKKHIAEADIVITTALVMGKKAPVLVTEEMVESMKTGAVIVDMAVESGGNCAISEMGSIVEKHGVKIIGLTNIPALLPVNASELYARNVAALLTHLATSEGLKWEMEEEVTQGSLITFGGQTVHAFTKGLLEKAN